jgi:hypothetical protein
MKMKLHNEEFHNLYSLPDDIKEIQIREDELCRVFNT